MKPKLLSTLIDAGSANSVSHMRQAFMLAIAVSGFMFSLLVCAKPVGSAEISARDVTVELYHSQPSKPANFERFNLRDLDLSGVNFKHARLGGADMFGVDLTRADLSGVDLRAARLDRVTILGAVFDGANLEGVSMLRPSVFSSLDNLPDETASFVGANLKDATVFGRFNGSNFRNVNLSGANLAPRDGSSFIEHIWRSEFQSSDLRGANLQGAKLDRVWFAFADMRGADLTGASLKHADLTGADLRGANLTGVDVTKADFSEAKIEGAIGIDTMIGKSSLRGLWRKHALKTPLTVTP